MRPALTKEKLDEMLPIPLLKAAQYADDPNYLVSLLTLAYNYGIKDGMAEANGNMNEAFKGYNAVNISN